MKNYQKRGYSLIELLVVIGIFALLGILVTQILISSMRASRKSEAINKVRGDLDYAISVMERQIRNATEIIAVTNLRIDYSDQRGNPTYFLCELGPGAGTIASGSANLVSDDVHIDGCLFSNIPPSLEGGPDSIHIHLSAHDIIYSGAEAAQVEVNTQVELRFYEY